MGSGPAEQASLAAVKRWADAVPYGEPILFAFVCLEEKVLRDVLSKLEPLGAPKEVPTSPYQAFAAVGVRVRGGSRWQACHASSGRIRSFTLEGRQQRFLSV